jgi:antitoxin component YwqK of YwqJK toxin-antitoxin module
VWTVYNLDTSIAKQETWKMDILNGPMIEYYAKKQPKTKGNYVNGQIDGKIIYYYLDSVVSVVGQYKTGLKEGNWFYYDQKTILTLKEIYKAGKLQSTERLHGEFEDFYPNQSLKSTTNYKLGKKEGLYKEFYEAKMIMPPNGETNESYLEPSAPKIMGNYKDGKQEGKWIFYTKDGNIEKTEFYKEGVLLKQ